METMNKNTSYADKCGIYRITEAELVVAKAGSNKNDYVRLSLVKVMKSGRLQMGFSHYFNIGIQNAVEEFKTYGVTEKGTSKENLAKLKEDYEAFNTKDPNVRYEYYGFFWTQEFGATYRNKETGKISSDTLVFIPCDEETGTPIPEFVMTAERLQEILKGYELVKQNTTEEVVASGQENEEDEAAAFAEYMRQKKAAESKV
jgi:hypothetical protein